MLPPLQTGFVLPPLPGCERPPAPALAFGVQGLGCGVWSVGCWVWDLGCGVWGVGFRTSGADARNARPHASHTCKGLVFGLMVEVECFEFGVGAWVLVWAGCLSLGFGSMHGICSFAGAAVE